ncbi:MAG TPA: 3-deoxy-D-manno-octulosonic acid transferase [Terriglobia bacterium]|nr:3-deoxy-D-manno-octulosonic acid transferase [Terriglobia bacterium]
MFLLYSLLFSVGVVLSAPYYLWRLRGNIVSGAGWRERFGFLPASFAQERRGAIWIHAVSVGETLAVAGLIRELRRRHPERKIFMSHVTPAGRKAGDDRLPAPSPNASAGGVAASRTAVVDGRFYLPLDWAWSTRRVVKRIRPALVVIVETELWPNLLRMAHQEGAQVLVVNARLSDRSFRGYRLARPFMRRVLSVVDGVYAQTGSDAERFKALGVPAERVAVTGNIKFDSRPRERGSLSGLLVKALEAAGRSPVIVAGSTMPGEEALLLEAWSAIHRSHPKALLILAPRHPARFEEVAQLLARSGLAFVRRTALEPAATELAAQLESRQVLLLNTIGELAGLFELADLVFVGGSLVPAGGHNLLEPAFSSKPILFGPHMQNFRDIAALFLKEKAAVQVQNASELARETLRLLEDSNERHRLGEAAKSVIERESGSTERILARLDTYLKFGDSTG